MNYKLKPLDEITINTFRLFSRLQHIILAGYIIVLAETFIAIKIGLTSMRFSDIMYTSINSIGISVVLIALAVYKKNLTVRHVWLLYFIHLFTYLSFYSIWVFYLNELRIFGLLSSLIASSIIMYYASYLQSILMIVLSFLLHCSITYSAIIFFNQPGSLIRESFLSFSLIPAFILVSSAARYLRNQRRDLNATKRRLENSNADLRDTNSILFYEQRLAKIELDLAHEIQSAIFPSKAPDTGDWDVSFVSYPRYGISGDFYDFYHSGTTLEGFSLFDVSGHGVAPALITILAKPVIYRNFSSSHSINPGFALDKTNSDLFEQLEQVHIFITGLILKINGAEIEYANAGHPDLLHFNSHDKTVRIINDEQNFSKGQPLGICRDKACYKSLKFPVSRDDILLVYSDCLLETRNISGEQYGVERIMSSLAAADHSSSENILNSVLNSFYSFVGNCEIQDDLTVIIARKK